MMRVRNVPLTNAHSSFRKRFIKTDLNIYELPVDDTRLSLPMVRGNDLEMRFINLTLHRENPLCPPNQYLCFVERGILVFPNIRNFALTYYWKHPSASEFDSALETLSYQHPPRYPNHLALVHIMGNRGGHFSRRFRYVTMNFDITSDPPYALFQSRFLDRIWHCPTCPNRSRK